MTLHRHHYFLLGLVLLFLGIQFRLVESFVMNAPASEFVSKRMGDEKEQATLGIASLFSPAASTPLRKVTPPQWLGWVLLSLGSVLVLHALAMPKPSG
jgi:hypothetical protein